MESNLSNKISINIPNYTGPLEILLDLAKSQKVNLADISITLLADQFLDFIKKTKNLNLETASDDDDDFKALEVANRLKLQLKKLELIRLLSDQLLKRKRIGRDIFFRGIKGGIKSIYTPIYDVNLYEILKTYALIKMQKSFQTVNIPKLPVLTTEEGIKLENLKDWTEIRKLVPKSYKLDKLKKTGFAGIFAACLELAKEGSIDIMQKELFKKIMVRKST